MSDTVVYALFHYRVKPGMEDRFQDYLAKVLPVTEAQEPYILGYEIFQAPDGSYFQHEHYENEEAVWKHLELTTDGQKDFAEATEMIHLTMVGNLTQKFRDTFLDGEGTDFKPFRSVNR
ncbi:antibiotic biosynthesis monooxygenase [Streptomyces sp. NBC_01390]|uniref:putative quinol monooxygenase n=1 Tax=Streptomyces sp. NBC_01390 TaxID=2903850 RepID=UPI0032497775